VLIVVRGQIGDALQSDELPLFEALLTAEIFQRVGIVRRGWLSLAVGDARVQAGHLRLVGLEAEGVVAELVC